MERWNLYSGTCYEPQGQFGSWQRAMGAIKTVSKQALFEVQFIADGYMRVTCPVILSQGNHEKGTYHVKREAI